MKRVCSWCKKELGTKEGPENLITHGCCNECYNRIMEEFNTMEAVVTEEVAQAWEKAADEYEDSLIEGGQGRSGEEVAFSATVVSCCFVGIMVILAVAWVIAMLK